VFKLKAPSLKFPGKRRLVLMGLDSLWDFHLFLPFGGLHGNLLKFLKNWVTLNFHVKEASQLFFGELL